MSGVDLDGARKLAVEAQERADKATPGPWRSTWDEPHHETFDESTAVATEAPKETLDPPDQMIVGTMWYDGLNSACRREDAFFIAAARSDVPALAAITLAMADELERLRNPNLLMNLSEWDILPGGTYEPAFVDRMHAISAALGEAQKIKEENERLRASLLEFESDARAQLREETIGRPHITGPMKGNWRP